jgi:hypothetical protein
MCMMHMLMPGMNHDGHDMQGQAQPVAAQNESLLDVLRRPYVLGEISQAQFEDMKRVLNLSDSALPAGSTHDPGQR